MKIRRLNHSGLREFESYLEELRTPGNQNQPPVPVHLLENPGYSEELERDVEIESQQFQSRFDMGKYLVEKLAGCDQQTISHDVGLWSWLALFYFDQLCPSGQDGRKQPRRSDNYILSRNRNNYHRHAIRTTYLLVRDYDETVHFMFTNPLYQRGELTEQITGRPYFFGCKGIIEAASHLYYDRLRNAPKRGAASKDGPGVVRRFGLVLRQLELTYDLFSLGRDEILNLLPREFDRFKVGTEVARKQSLFKRVSNLLKPSGG